MKRLKAALLEANIRNVDHVYDVVEDFLSERIKHFDGQASILCEKYDGDPALVHYYAGQGMILREFVEDIGIAVDLERNDYDQGA